MGFMMLHRLLFLLVMCLAGCASSPYLPKEGERPEGYSENQVSPGTYQVTYETYKEMDWGIIADMALYRAAELARSGGYSYLTISDSQKKRQLKLVNMPAVRMDRPTLDRGVAWQGMHREIPAHTMEFSVRSISLSVTFSNEQGDGRLNVADIMASIKDERDI